MIRLNLSNEPKWTTLVGSFEIFHDPVSATVMSIAAREATGERVEDRIAEITKSVARAVIREWRGVVDDTSGKDVPVTPETVNAVMDIWPIFRAFNERVIDARMRVEREKKDLSPLQNGTSGAAEPIAPTAKAPARTARPKKTRLKR
jgi:hypothetical protein